MQTTAVSFQVKLPYSFNVAAVVVYDGLASSIDLPETPFDQLSTEREIPNQGFNLVDYKYNSLNQTEAQFQYFPFNIFRVSVSVASRIREQTRKFNPADGEIQSDWKPSSVLQSNGRMFACPPDFENQKEGEDSSQQTTSNEPFVTGNSSVCPKDSTCAPVGDSLCGHHWESYGFLLSQRFWQYLLPWTR